MMDSLRILELKRLFKKLEWVEADYEYQSGLISSADTLFMKSVNEFLKGYPELKEVYESNKEEPIESEKVIEKVVDKDSKDLYRKIAKETHPDKINNELLNSMYVEANEAYENGDYLGLLKLSMSLDIFPEDSIPIDDIKERIDSYEKRTEFLKKTFTWKWLEAEGEEDKGKVIVDYIGKYFK